MFTLLVLSQFLLRFHYNQHYDLNIWLFFILVACSYAKGKWIKDNRRPLYSGSGCKQWLSAMWACRLMKRTDFSYEHFRWKPQGCDLPEFSGGKLLQRHV